MLVLLAGCTAVNVDMGIAKTTITLALAEPSSVATITTDDSIPVIATTVAGAATSQVQSNYNCAGMVVLPKSVYRALKAKAFPDGMPTATPAALNIPLGGAALTVGTVIVETGEPIEIAYIIIRRGRSKLQIYLFYDRRVLVGALPIEHNSFSKFFGGLLALFAGLQRLLRNYHLQIALNYFFAG